MLSHLASHPNQVLAALSRWLAEQALHGFFATDSDFKIIAWNRWMEVHSGHSASAVLGRSIFDVYPDLAARGICDYYTSALEGHVTVVSHGLHRYVLPF